MATPYPGLEPLVAEGLVLTDLESRDVALSRIARAAAPHSGVPAGRIFEALLAREEKMPTTTPSGIAFPHALLPDATRQTIVPAVLRPAIPFGGGADRMVDVLLAVVGHSDGAGHLQTLARLARLCRDGEVVIRLRGAASGAEAGEVMRRALSSGA